jgi:hypothetical protein
LKCTSLSLNEYNTYVIKIWRLLFLPSVWRSIVKIYRILFSSLMYEGL